MLDACGKLTVCGFFHMFRKSIGLGHFCHGNHLTSLVKPLSTVAGFDPYLVTFITKAWIAFLEELNLVWENVKC